MVYNKANSKIFKKVQLKSSYGGGFSFKRNYLNIEDLLCVFIIDLVPNKSDSHQIYGMTNKQFEALMLEGNIKYNKNGVAFIKTIPKKLVESFEAFKITDDFKFRTFFQ